MRLCSLCSATTKIAHPTSAVRLPFGRIRYSFDDGGYCAYFMHPGETSLIDEPTILPYHDSREALKESAKTCNICNLVLDEIERRIGHRDAPDAWLSGDDSMQNWSFRLVSRKDGVDGFTVLAKEGSWASIDDSPLHVVAAVGFCRGTDDMHPKQLRGSMVDSDAGLQRSLDKVATWIRDCICTHQDICPPPVKRLPTRILDLNAAWHDGKVRLHDSSSESRREGEYIALSYCWGGSGNDDDGDAHHFMTTTETLRKHTAGIPVDELPKTFRDAVKVTRYLGIRYLWIDALCICQDDADDWARESASMKSIYAGAYAVIAADRASVPSAGFLERPQRAYVPVTLATPEGGTMDTMDAMACVTDPQLAIMPTFWVQPPWEPLSKRGWTLQERLLPTRVLHYGTEQMFFECNCHFLSEDGYLMTGRWGSVQQELDMRTDQASWFHKYNKAWETVVVEYKTRQLTVGTDMLPAIAGLAQSFLEKFRHQLPDGQKVEYLAGLWSHSIFVGLLWRGLNRELDDEQGPPPELPLPGELGYIAPSWSWAALAGEIDPVWWSIEDFEAVATVTEWQMTLKNKSSPLGEVIDGWLRLRGPLFPVTVPEHFEEQYEGEEVESDLFPGQGHQYYGRLDTTNAYGPRTRRWLQGKHLFAAVVGKTPTKKFDGAVVYHTLLIEARERTDNGSMKYTKLGTMDIWSHEPSEYMDRINDPSSVAEVLLV